MQKGVSGCTHIIFIFYRSVASLLVHLLGKSFWKYLSIASMLLGTVLGIGLTEITKSVFLFLNNFQTKWLWIQRSKIALKHKEKGDGCSLRKSDIISALVLNINGQEWTGLTSIGNRVVRN